MKWMRCGAAVLAVLFLRTDAFAEDPGGWYLAVKAGTYSPGASDMGINKLRSGTVGEIEVDAGYLVSPNVAVEAGYMSCNAERTLPATDAAATTAMSVSATAFLVTVRGVLPLANDTVELSAGAGIGSYRLDVDVKDPPPPPVTRTVNGTETGYHFTAGVDYRVTKRIALGLEYKRFSVELDGTDLGGDAFSLGVRYRF